MGAGFESVVVVAAPQAIRRVTGYFGVGSEVVSGSDVAGVAVWD